MALTRPFTNYNINFTCRCLSAKFCGAIREDGTKEWRRRFTSVFSVTAHCNAQFQVYLSQGFKGNSRASGGNICDLRKAELRSVTVFLCCANSKHVSWTFRSVKVVVVVVSLIGVASYPQARQSRRIARHARRDVHATRLFFQGEGKTVQKRTTVPPLMPSK